MRAELNLDYHTMADMVSHFGCLQASNEENNKIHIITFNLSISITVNYCYHSSLNSYFFPKVPKMS